MMTPTFIGVRVSMTARGHDTFEHTADMGITGWASGPEGALEEAAQAMFELIYDVEGVKAQREITVHASARGPDGLLVEFLNELLSRADLEDLAFTKVEIESIDVAGYEWSGRGRVSGVDRNGMAGRFLSEVKAATWHMAYLGREPGGMWRARCVVDM